MAFDTIDDLPLLYRTPVSWATRVLKHPLVLLSDHAHLEKKAAINALALLNRWPEPAPPENWVQVLTAIARDEIEHLAVVTRLLARRGGRLARTHANNYAGDLRKSVRVGRGQEELLDRLCVSALIEARSCERFALLAEAAADVELRRIYSGLWASEAGHFQTFLNLAEQLPERLNVEVRWREWLEIESALIQQQSDAPAMHSSV